MGVSRANELGIETLAMPTNGNAGGSWAAYCAPVGIRCVIVKSLKEKNPDTKICVGGAPVTQEYCDSINADMYSADPQGIVEYLNKLAS